jgi:hypothetical protein
LVKTYHALKTTFSGYPSHQHDATSLTSTLDLFFSKAFIVIVDHIDVKMAIIRRCRCDQNMSSFGIVAKIEGMKALVGWLEFKETISGVDFENTTTVTAVVRDVMFLGKKMDQENVGNAILIDVVLDPEGLNTLSSKLLAEMENNLNSPRGRFPSKRFSCEETRLDPI